MWTLGKIQNNFSFKVDGCFTNTDGKYLGWEEEYSEIRVDTAPNGLVLYAASVIVCGHDYIHGPTGECFQRVLRSDM